MTFTFVCQSCDDSFELEYAALTEGTKGLKCPNCSKKLPSLEVDELVTAIDDVLGQVAALRKRFAISFDVDAEDLPPPYDTDRKAAAAEGDDDDEDEDDDDDAAADDEPGDGEDEDRF
jgi:DNA-directed RNA polymerase subunit RPC12/RpoP